MPLVECVGGYLDGKRFEVARLDEKLTDLLENGSSRTEYAWAHRRTSDGLAEVYCHWTLDEVYFPEVQTTVAHLRSEFPEHQIDYQITNNSVDFAIVHERVRKVFSLSKSPIDKYGRPDIFDICLQVRSQCGKAG